MTIFNTIDDIISSKKKYQIIYADPPWKYSDKALVGNRGAGCKYDVMDINDICNLPISKIADDDSVLMLWSTWPKTVDGDAVKVIKSWGYEPKTCVFVRVKRHGTGTIFKGMGRWTRANTEFILLGIKGKPKRLDAGIEQVIEATPKEHSRKPDIFRAKIIQLLGDLSRIELFSRTIIHGWDVFGNDPKLQDQPLEMFT